MSHLFLKLRIKYNYELDIVIIQSKYFIFINDF